MGNIDVISIYRYRREENIDMISIFANIAIPNAPYHPCLPLYYRPIEQRSSTEDPKIENTGKFLIPPSNLESPDDTCSPTAHFSDQSNNKVQQIVSNPKSGKTVEFLRPYFQILSHTDGISPLVEKTK